MGDSQRAQEMGMSLVGNFTLTFGRIQLRLERLFPWGAADLWNKSRQGMSHPQTAALCLGNDPTRSKSPAPWIWWWGSWLETAGCVPWLFLEEYQIFPFGWERGIFRDKLSELLHHWMWALWKAFRCSPSQVRLEPGKFCPLWTQPVGGVNLSRLESKETSFQVSFQSAYWTAFQDAFTCMRDYLYINEHLLSTDLVPRHFSECREFKDKYDMIFIPWRLVIMVKYIRHFNN